jgi:condensin complex subunit 1
VISVLSYCKFMCLSPSYCEKKINPILDLLIRTNINSVVKNNIIIAMGDLLHRFPNIVEPYNHFLYRNLQDKDIGVRKTTLTVLTHLSLNDMIKVRSDLCDIALLFKD